MRREAHLAREAFTSIVLLLLLSALSALCGPITVELTGGSIIKGDLVSWDGQQVLVKTDFGLMPFRRDQMNQATIDRLEFLARDRQSLLTRISDLEATVRALQKENAALKQQLQTTPAAPRANAIPAEQMPAQ